MIHIFPLPDLLAAVAAFWCDLLTTRGILLRQRDTDTDCRINQRCGWSKGDPAPALAQTQNVQDVSLGTRTCLERQEEI